MIRFLYSVLMGLLQPFVRAKLRRRASAEPGYGEYIEERFGHYAEAPGSTGSHSDTNGFYVWVHAVSLGETRAAAPLVAQLRLALPGMRLLLTHGTATGREQGRSLLQDGDAQVWQPWDTPGAVQRFLKHFQPRVGLLVETEIWPNMVAACARTNIPLCLVNARLSEKSMRQARRLAWLSGPAYRGLRAVWAQAPEDARRLSALGAPVLGVTGNFKFDATPDPALLEQGRNWRQVLARPVVVFASSREGEEALLLQKLKRLSALAPVEQATTATKNIASEVQWLIVPRHPQRFDAVVQLCAEQGFSVSRRSQWDGVPQEADIWVGDSLGEMALYYGLSDLALLGGSFEPLGGQNLIEAAACGCPVVMGPHTFNFVQATELAVAAGAAFEAPDLGLAVEKAMALLRSQPQLQMARHAALDLSLAHRGAAARTAQAVKNIVLASRSP
ncbi:MAG: 3-deoxy-D-manno-octulosonic acid transferase [Burkholderiales bacterium]